MILFNKILKNLNKFKKVLTIINDKMKRKWSDKLEKDCYELENTETQLSLTLKKHPENKFGEKEHG